VSPEIAEKIDWIRNKLENSIKSFEKKKNYNRKMSVNQHILVAILAGVIASLSAFNVDSMSETIRTIISALGVLIAYVNLAFRKLFSNNRLWVKYTNATNQLKAISDDFEFNLAGIEETITIQELSGYQIKIQKALNDINTQWELIRSNSE